MYREYFDLTSNPFSMTPQPSMVYMTPGHREALAGLAYAVFEKKGFVVLVGEAGTGKSTLLARTLHHMLTNRVVSSVILNPTLNESEFLELMMLDFGFPTVPESKAQRLIMFQEFLIKTNRAGKIAVLVVDEAHKMTPAVLEEVRLLSNLELPGEKLLQIVLAGQPELVTLLNRPDLRQLSQRISVRLRIDRLTESEIEHYVTFRWTRNSFSAPPFTADSYASIARFSHGIPRLVNAICDNALTLAFAEKSRTVESRHIEEACRDLWLVDRPSEADGTNAHAPLNGATAGRAGMNDNSGAIHPAPVPVAGLRVLESYREPRRSFWSWVTRSRPAQERGT
jgi:general secretion pathway protein A